MIHLTLALTSLLAAQEVPVPPTPVSQAPVPETADLGELARITVGHFVEIRGELTPDGRFVGEKIELLQPDEDVLIGTIPSSERNRARFVLLGQIVETDQETSWGISDPIAGKRVKVEGSWKGPTRFYAEDVEDRGEGRDRIGGRVDEWHRVEGGWRARVMTFDVFLPDGVEFEHEQPIEAYELAQERLYGTAYDPFDIERDEDDAFGEGILIARNLRFTGQLEGKITHEKDYDLVDGPINDEDDRTDYAFSPRIRLVWTPSPRFWGLIEGRWTERYRRQEDDGVNDSENDHTGSIGEAWLTWRDVNGWPGFDVTVGRQDFDDEREWIYDENLDGLRLSWLRPSWRLDVSGSTTLNGGLRNENSDNLIAYLSNNDDDRHLATWTVYRDIDGFTDSGGNAFEPEKSWHVGARAIGDWLPDSESWLDLAYQMGERDGRDVRAWAYDAGTTWEPDFAEDWYFTVGYALGSGDDSTSGSDGTFRQTGFQDNTSKFGGVTSFNYYGELSDLELSNLGILTLGVGKVLAERTSLDLVYHQYTQDVALPSFSPRPDVDSDIDLDPSGTDADLGNEIDLVFGFRALDGWDLEIVTARFDPGDAFAGDDPAWLFKFQLRYRF
jgi:hypothetical protein